MTAGPGARGRQRRVRAPAPGLASKIARLRALRRRADPDEPIVMATVRFRLPDAVWVGRFSHRHPEVRIEILNYSEVGAARSVADCWISGLPAGRWASELAHLPDVYDVVSLGGVGRGCLYRLTFENPPIIYLYRKLGVPLPLPIWSQAGNCSWEVVARYPEFRRILEFGRAVDPRLRIVALRRGPLQSHLPALTVPQQRLLTAAMGAGFFEVPRRVTLEQLADRLGRSPSALSEAIASVEEKLLESAFTGTSFRAPLRSGTVSAT